MAVIYLGKSGRRPAFTLPADAVTRTFGIFGVKDSGKTTTARVLAEGITKLGGYVVILDPVGVWWGITRDGEGPGVPGIVLGGEHADVPLEETGGQLVSELAVAREYPAVVVDLKLLRKGAAQRFMADFLEGVYFSNRRPLHVIFEEADRALPQSPRGMDPTLGRVLGAAEDIVKLGRSRGLGSTFISQRMSTVTKNVTEQVEALILHAQIGPNDRKAVKAWVEGNGDPAAMAKVMDSMASLDVGEAWVYSPKWLRALERIHARRPKTLDSSSTPNDDERVVEEKAPRAPVDLDTLRARMAETVERAKANDPKELQKRIAELERQLAAEEREQPEPVRVLVPDAPAVAELGRLVSELDAADSFLRSTIDESRGRLSEALDRIESTTGRIETAQRAVSEVYESAAALPRDGLPATFAQDPPPEPRPTVTARKLVEREERRAAGRARAEANGNGDGGPTAGALELASVIAGLHPLWLTRGQVAVFARRGSKSSTLTQHLAELRDAGLVEVDRGRYRACGPAVSGAALSPAEMRRRLDEVLPDGPRALYRVLVEDGELSRAELFSRAGFSPTSSTPVGHLKVLTDNGIAERVAGGVGPGPLIR